MKKVLLAASLFLNLALAGAIGFVLGTTHRETVAPNASLLLPATSLPPSGRPSPLTSPLSPEQPPEIALATVPFAPQNQLATPAADSSRALPTSLASPVQPIPALPAPLEDQSSDDETTLGTKETINPVAPGNTFTFRGVRVGLAATYQAAGKGGRSLAVDLTPALQDGDSAESNSPLITQDSGQSSSSLEASNAENSPSAKSRSRSDATSQFSQATTISTPFVVTATGDEVQANGFTREEELFRMKWGWAALDAARSEARRESGESRQSSN